MLVTRASKNCDQSGPIIGCSPLGVKNSDAAQPRVTNVKTPNLYSRNKREASPDTPQRAKTPTNFVPQRFRSLLFFTSKLGIER